jgi:hypothetical protein
MVQSQTEEASLTFYCGSTPAGLSFYTLYLNKLRFGVLSPGNSPDANSDRVSEERSKAITAASLKL